MSASVVMLLVDLDKFSKLFLAPELTRGSETSAAGILKNKNYIIIMKRKTSTINVGHLILFLVKLSAH